MGSYVSYFTGSDREEFPKYIHASRPTYHVYEEDATPSQFTPIHSYASGYARAESPEWNYHEAEPIEEYRVINSASASSSRSGSLSLPLSGSRITSASQVTLPSPATKSSPATVISSPTITILSSTTTISSPTTAISSPAQRRSVRVVQISGDIKKSERKTHKCRGRAESVAWFDVMALTPWDEPPQAANQLYELADGDLLLNWLDSNATRCQVWKFVWRFAQEDQQMLGDWRKLKWGAKCSEEDPHHLIITEKGQPSFVAEATWKKKYKMQTPKIVA